MPAPTEEQPAVVRRIQLGTSAWRLLTEATAAAAGLEPNATSPLDDPDAAQQPAMPLDPAAADAAWAELATLGLSPAPGEIDRQWLGAVALLLAAPITVTARATYNGISTTSVLGLRGGRGIAAHQRQLSKSTASGTEVTGTEDSIEVTLFAEEKLWPAVQRLLPPLEVVRAPAQAAPLDSTPVAMIGAQVELDALPEPAARLLAGEDANVTLSVATTRPGLPVRLWAGMWSVNGGHLYSLRTKSSAAPEPASPKIIATEVPAGHIANELIFAVVGGHDALAAATAGATL